jgi:hypothetical protein
VFEQVVDERRVAGAGSAVGPNPANWWLGQKSGAHVGPGFGGVLSAVARGLCAALVCTVLNGHVTAACFDPKPSVNWKALTATRGRCPKR